MWILALDGSPARCSAAVLADGRIVARESAAAERGHAAILPPMVGRVLAAAGITAPQLDAVAVGVGPGGFTGLRAALALAQGMALGAGLPLVGVTTGEALVAALAEEERRGGRAVWSAIDTRRGGGPRVVLERFAPGAAVPLGPPESFAEAELPHPPGPVALVGDAALAVAARLLARGADARLTDRHLPDAADLARVGALRLAGRLPPRGADPLYVEPPAVRTTGAAPAGPAPVGTAPAGGAATAAQA
jgi:tRNA threonylcarbamoyladenosine biosynthesis protein TsaB